MAEGTADAAQRPSRRRWLRPSISLSSRLAATVLAVGFVSMIAATVVGVTTGQQLGRDTVEDSLVAMRSSGSFDVVAQLRHYERLAEQLAASPQAPAAVRDFAAGIADLSGLSAEDVRQESDDLLVAYQQDYIEPLGDAGSSVVAGDVLSDDPVAVYLQANYALPEGPLQEPILIDDAGDGSLWSAAHAQFHPVYRNAVYEADLIDIYLVDAASERIVYSAAKRPDLGTSLSVGPYRGSIVGRAAAEAGDSDGGIVTDLSFYDAVPDVPIGAAAAPVLVDGQAVGAVVLTYDSAVYTDRLAGIVEAGIQAGERNDDLYLIGSNGRTRSDPQSYLADPAEFLDESVEAGILREPERVEIEDNGTTVLVAPAADSTLNAALDGDTAANDGTSLTGAPVIQVVDRIPVTDVEWFTVAEINAIAADSVVVTFRQTLLVGAAVFVIALAFVAVAWARRVMEPVRAISERLGRAAVDRATRADFEPLRLPDRSPVELHRLADSFSTMGRSLQAQQKDLQSARTERLEVLKRMLPASVAQRIARGDIESLEEVPVATVVVVVVLGLSDLVHAEAGGQDRIVLDELHAELDDIALEHGLERIRVVGDSYLGVCGHDRPYIDHAARVVAFATHVADAVRALSASSSAELDTAIAINTGPVTVGMSGGDRLVYDVWGPTVTVAHDIARITRAGEIVVTESTRTRLPDDIELTRRPVIDDQGGDGPSRPGAGLWAVAGSAAVSGATTQEEASR